MLKCGAVLFVLMLTAIFLDVRGEEQFLDAKVVVSYNSRSR